jgi:hypothetical protein
MAAAGTAPGRDLPAAEIAYPRGTAVNDTGSQNETIGNGSRRPHGGLTVKVCLLGSAVGAFFGSFAYPLGTVLGGAGGLAAGLLWTWIMLRRVRPQATKRQILNAGALWGIVVGMIATAILHGGLAVFPGWVSVRSPYFEPYEYPYLLVVASTCAFFGGTISGTICGAMVARMRGLR